MTETPDPSYADRLRAVADLLDAHPDLPLPCVFAYGGTASVDVSWQLMNTAEAKDSQLPVMQQIVRTIGGHWDKRPWDDRFDMLTVRDGLKLEVFAHRDQVCERVVTGVEDVTIPAVEARPERVEQREVVEWHCAPVLADREDEAVPA